MATERVSKFSGKFHKTIKVPGDKSISHRSIMLGALAEGTTVVHDFLMGEDCLCTKKAFEAMGVEIQIEGDHITNKVTIQGKGFDALTAPSEDIYLGNSGTGMRLLSGLFAPLPFEVTLTGDESLSARPMGRVLRPLESMGAKIKSHNNQAPLTIQGSHDAKLQGIHYESPIASAQVKSCILLAGLNAEGTTTVTEPHLSRDHTERMLQAFGVELEQSEDKLTTSVEGQAGKLKLEAQEFKVPADISSAAFFLVLGSILEDAELTLPAVGMNPSRTGIIDVLHAMNADLTITNERLEGAEPVADLMIKSSKLQATTIGGDIIPRLIDEIPVISILAAQAEGTTIIKDAAELKVKESNRIATTVNMLKHLGVKVEETEDGMIIEGRAGLAFDNGQEVSIDSHGDHRLAMSSAVAAMHSNTAVEILQTEFVKTSFPGFFDLLELKQVA